MKKIESDTFTKKDIEKLRKDTLTLLKAVEKESSYDEAFHVKQAIIKYEDYLDKLFYKKMAPLIKNENANQAFRKITWDFYVNLSLPLLEPNEYYTKEQRYNNWLGQKNKWLNGTKRRARVVWKAIDDYFLQGEDKTIDTFEPYRVNLHGFNVVFEDEPTKVNYNVIDHTLKIAQDSILDVFPKILKRKPTLVFQKQENIDNYGQYDLYERKCVFNLYHFNKYIKNPKNTAQAVIHELAHDIYREYLSDKSITYWETAIRGDYGDLHLSTIVDHWPDSMEKKSLYYLGEYYVSRNPILAIKLKILTLQRQLDFRNKEDAIKALEKEDIVYKVPKSPITYYAAKNPEEAFCEAFSTYAVFGQKSVLPLVRLWLKTVLSEASVAMGTLKVVKALKQILKKEKSK